MDFAITIGVLGWVLLVLGALAVGVVIALIGRGAGSYEWALNSVGAAVGAVIGSEFIVGLRTIGPAVDGVTVVPAAVGGIILAVVLAAIARFITVDEPAPRAMSAR
jgi:hypothetical protein